MNKQWIVLLVSALVLMASACSPIPEDYEKALTGVESVLKKDGYKGDWTRVDKTVRGFSDKASYQALFDSADHGNRKQYVLDEAAKIRQAAKALRAMEELDDTPGNQRKIRDQFNVMRGHVVAHKAAVQQVRKDYRQIAKIIDDRDNVEAEIANAISEFSMAYASVKKKMEKAIDDHPHQTARIKEFNANLLAIGKVFNWLEMFFGEPADSLTMDDYNLYLEKYRWLKLDGGFPVSLAKDYERMLDQLYQSYSKVLLSASEYHSIAIGMVTWDNYYDYPTETTRIFPYVEVNHSFLEKARSYLARGMQASKSSLTSNAVLKHATEGRIAQGWPSGDDEGEVWIEDYESEFTHQYLLVENGKSSTIEESVDEATYRKYANAIDQEVFSKPYGKFEDEAIDQAQPPGMAFVGNPQYGQWQRDPISGGEIWMWFAAYSIFDDIIDDRIDRRRHQRYMANMNGYVPPRHRNNYTGTNAYGVTSGKSSFQQSLTRSRSQGVRGSGESFRNRGPGKGK